MSLTKKRVEYFITDGRPLESALVCDTATSLREARRERPHYGEDAQIWEVDVDERGVAIGGEETWRLVT